MPAKPKSKRKAGRPAGRKRVFLGTNISIESDTVFRAFAKAYDSLGLAMDALINRIK